MSPTLQSMGIDKLSRDEKIALVHEIWESVAAESGQFPLSDSQRRELARRIAEDDANPDDVVTWDQIKAEALARLKR